MSERPTTAGNGAPAEAIEPIRSGTLRPTIHLRMCLAFLACELNAKRYSTGTREISFGWKEIELGGG